MKTAFLLHCNKFVISKWRFHTFRTSQPIFSQNSGPCIIIWCPVQILKFELSQILYMYLKLSTCLNSLVSKSVKIGWSAQQKFSIWNGSEYPDTKNLFLNKWKQASLDEYYVISKWRGTTLVRGTIKASSPQVSL